LFSFLLTVKIKVGDGLLKEHVFRYLLSGFVGDVECPDNPTDWIDDNEWPGMYGYFYGLKDVEPCYNGIFKHFTEKPEDFKEYYESPEPENCKLPEPWESKLSQFEKLLLLRNLRLDKTIEGVRLYIEK